MNEMISSDKKANLLGYGLDRLESFFLQMNEKPFRAKQVLKWIHQRGVTDFDLMTDLSAALRSRLNMIAEIKPPEVVSYSKSEDGSSKWLISVEGGEVIEAVFIPERGRGTLCVSSQAGCSVDCSFCATGKQGFNRNLSVEEIIGQVWIANQYQQQNSIDKKAVTNVVLMGMGEPLLNFENVVESVNLMMEDCAYGLSKRRVTLSTSGIVPMLDKLSELTDVSLAVSLHAPNDELRNVLVPINKKYPISVLLESARRYITAMPDSHRRITIEYTLIRGVNDDLEKAKELSELLRDTPCKINLIPFNPFPGSLYQQSHMKDIKAFQSHLINQGYTTTIRTTRGNDIAAACGQLAGMIKDKTKRSERYARKSLENEQA